MRLASNLCAASDARLAFAIIDMPEIFECFTVRESVRMLEVHTQPGSVTQRVGKNLANGLMQSSDAFRSQRSRNLEWVDLRTKERLGRVDVSESKHSCLIQQ